MTLEQGKVYHVYNRGNNKQKIFFDIGNYRYFREKIRTYVVPVCDILAWCLMPNHFHFLIHANEKSTVLIKDGSFERQAFSQSIKQLLSSYTKGINKQHNRTGSLFQQKTKAICVSNVTDGYPLTAFQYIHQNPVKANLRKKMEQWEFSSFNEYLSLTEEGRCRIELACELLDLRLATFYSDSYKATPHIVSPSS